MGNEAEKVIITVLEYQKGDDQIIIGTNKGSLYVYNILSLNSEEEYHKLHDSSITSVAFCQNTEYYYSCSFDKILKKTKNKLTKEYVCSGYCKMIKPKSVSNFLIGIDEDQKNIYIFDEITEK